MNDGKRELLMAYIKSNIAPILIDFEFPFMNNSVIISANCDLKELNGYYNENNFEAPDWYKKIKNNKMPSILIIDSIDKIRKEEQTKFIEILKYRKVSTFELPIDTIIIITAQEINENTINNEVYSLVAHIKE